MLILQLILLPVVLGESPSVQEILWNFCCVKDKKKRLTLKENPRFYTELPTLMKAHGDSVNIDSTEDFRHADKFYVLTDKQEPIHIMTGNKILHSFGSLWRSENGIILKGSGVFFEFPPVSDFLTDICGRLMGESIVKETLNGTFGEYYATRLPVSTGVRRAFRTRKHRELHSIGTKLYPWTGWERFIDGPPMHTSADFCSVCVLIKQVAPNSPVRSKVIAYLTTSANLT